MALSPSSSPNIINGAMGQLSVVCCQFTSDEDLTGEVVNFIPSLFSSNTNPPNNPTNQYLLTYPSVGPAQVMNFVGSATNQNYVATIEALDSKNFIICLEFFWFSDIGYISENSYNNYQIFANNSASVYDSQSNINLYVDIGGNSSVCSVPASGNEFCVDDLTFVLGQYGGFCIGKDLVIDIISPLSAGIGNTMYVGFYQENALSNTVNFVNDSGLNYVQINNGVTTVDSLDGSTFESSCIKDGLGFTSDTFQSTSQVTIDQNCLKAGGKYRLYIVYKHNGEWKSCRSEQICQVTTKLIDFTEDMISCSVVDSLGNTYEDCCVTGLAPCGNIEVCLTLNRAVIEAALADIGWSGTVEDYLKSTKIYVSQGPATTSGLSAQVNNNDLTYCTTINANDRQGDHTVNFCFTFEFIKNTTQNGFPTQGQQPVSNVSGVTQRLCVPVRIGFVEPIEYLPTFTLDGEEITEVYCCESGGIIGFSTPETGCQAYLSEGYSDYVDIGSVTTLEAENLDCEGVQCVKLVCSGEPDITEEPDDCCVEVPFGPPPILTGSPMYFFVRECTDSNGNGVLDDRVIRSDYDLTGTGTGGPTDSWSVSIFGSRYHVYNTATEADYDSNAGDLFSFDVSGQVPQFGCVFTPPTIDCSDCPEECEDVNTGYVDWECTEDGITKCETVANLESVIDTDTGDQKTEIQDSEGNVIKCTISRTITFVEDCPPLLIEDVIECDINKPCINSRDIEYELDADCKLTITNTDNFDSNVLSDKFYVKINGTTTEYDLLTETIPNPIQLQDGDQVCLWSTTIFDDGCANLNKAKIEFTATKESNANCDGFTLDCEYDDENCKFTVSYSGESTVRPIAYLNGTAIPITITGQEIQGDGTLVIVWEVPNCPDPLVKTCFGKRKVEVCNLDEIEINLDNITVEPVINFNPTIIVNACCDETECQFPGGTISCEDCTLIFTANGDVSEWAFTWCNSNGDQVGTGLSYEATESGVFTLKANKEGCDEMEFNYTFNKPNAGMTNNDSNNPIIIQ